MTTFEDAAEELMVKLRGLDSEIDESEHTLEELRGRSFVKMLNARRAATAR